MIVNGVYADLEFALPVANCTYFKWFLSESVFNVKESFALMDGGGIVTIPKDVWVHIRTDISRTQNIAKIKITNGNTVLYSGTIPYQSTESAAGIYVLNL